MEKYGFVYLWYDRKHKRYYVGCRWGNVDDGYVCSSWWMKKSYIQRPQDFKRRVLKTNIPSRQETYVEELRWLKLIKESEIKPQNETPRYYNLNIKNNEIWHKYDEHVKTVGQKISRAKKGKPTSHSDPEAWAKSISEGKKLAFQRRFEETGYKISDEVRATMSRVRMGKKHTTEQKTARSENMKRQWADGIRHK